MARKLLQSISKMVQLVGYYNCDEYLSAAVKREKSPTAHQAWNDQDLVIKSEWNIFPTSTSQQKGCYYTNCR